MTTDETEVDIDFSDEISSLTAAIVLARQVGEQWADIDIGGMRSSLDDNALALTESKEDYLHRRKGLAGTVRNFKQKFASNNAEWSNSELMDHAEKVIDTFKTGIVLIFIQFLNDNVMIKTCLIVKVT
mgnify:CR=1 FL=1